MAGLAPFLRFASLAPAIGAALIAGTALGQTSASDKASAEALFDQGVRLMKQNGFSDACPKLEESERIDPAVGTLLYLGECYERVGKTASAWATFREAASLANNSNQADRARVAGSRAQDIEPKLSRLSVELAPDVARITGVVVKRSGQRLEPSLFGTPLPVDPGEYRIEVSAPGYETWTTPIKVESGGASASVRVPALVKSTEPVAPGATPAAAGGSGTAKPIPLPPLLPADANLTTQQTLGIVVGGIGVIGLGLGSYFGIRAISKNSEAEQQCPNAGLCNNDRGLSLTDQARKQASASNIAFAAGGVFVATGAVLYLTGGRTSSSERLSLVPLLAPGAAAASISGRF